MGNLLEEHNKKGSIISDEDAASGGVSLVKVYVLISVVAALAGASSLSFMSGHPLAGTFFLLLFLASYIVEALVLEGGKYALISAVMSGLALSLFLFTPPFRFFFIFTLALIFFLFWAHYAGSKDFGNMVKLSFFNAARATGSLVIIGSAIFFSYILVANGNIFLQEKNISRMVDIVAIPIIKAIPAAEPFDVDFSSNTTLDEFVDRVTEKMLSGDIRYQRLTERNKEIAFAESRKVVAEQIRALAGEETELNFEASITSNVQSYLQDVSSNIPEDQKVAWAGTILIFILLTALGFKLLVYYPVALIGFMLYELLIGAGFMQVKLETRTKEVIELN